MTRLITQKQSFLLLCALFLTTQLFSAEVTLQVTSLDNQLVSKSIAGEPFFLSVIIDGAQPQDQPVVEGVEKFPVLETGTYFSQFNNSLKTEYRYKLRISTPGDYTLGPATVEIDDQKIQTNTVKISVTTEQNQAVQPKQPENNLKPAYLHLSVEKTEAFVGEKINASLSFFYADNSISFIDFAEHQLHGLIAKPGVKNKQPGKQLIGNKQYFVKTWNMELYPQKLGTISIPAYHATYSMPTQQRGFYSFFGPQRITHWAHSNTATLVAHDLPAHNTPVNAIGTFSSFTAALDPSTEKEGEGMIFTLTLSGDGNIKNISAPKLQNMPRHFKWYESKVSLKEDDNPSATFEYIVQGFKPGTTEITAQELTYFDTNEKTYKTLASEPISVTILPNEALAKNSPQEPRTQKPTEKEEEVPEEVIKPLNRGKNWRPTGHRPMTPFYFFLFLFLTLAYRWGIRLKATKNKYLSQNYTHLKRRAAFHTARKEIKKVCSTNNCLHLYRIFVTLCATRLRISDCELDHEQIKKIMKQANWTDQEINEWDRFFSALAKQRYSNMPQKEEKTALCEQAEKWISKLEKIL